MKKFLGCILLLIGASLWKPAFDKGDGYVDDYNNLNVFEKLGFNMFAAGLRMNGYDEEKLKELKEFLD